jgi:magnesium-transporting ATPase (P-type)
LTLEPQPNRGLAAATAADRLKQDGFNELPSPDKRGFLRILGEVLFVQIMVVMLLMAARLTSWVLLPSLAV